MNDPLLDESSDFSSQERSPGQHNEQESEFYLDATIGGESLTNIAGGSKKRINEIALGFRVSPSRFRLRMPIVNQQFLTKPLKSRVVLSLSH